jgi:hypothetical protein
LNSVDLPTFGRPTMATVKFMSGRQTFSAGRGFAVRWFKTNWRAPV